MVIIKIRDGLMSVALLCITGILLAGTANAEKATKEEIDAAVDFYGRVKGDSNKLQAYCDVRQGIGMMASDPKKFAEAQQKVSAATKKLGPDFTKAQSLSTRLDMKSEDTKRYTAARHELDQSCP